MSLTYKDVLGVGGKLVNLNVEHQEIKEQSDFYELVTDEVATFCVAWKQMLDNLIGEVGKLDILKKNYGYDIRYRFQDDILKWFFQLELYYPTPGFEQKISYLKINRFITLPTRQGSGHKVFNELLSCCEHLTALEMIRLRAVRNAIGFWKKQNFREQSENVEWVIGDSMDYDLGCLKRPKPLTKCQFIFDLKRCDCDSCCSYYK